MLKDGTPRPFFSFFGGKWRDSPKNYPAPNHDKIIEPFAGSAGYALRYYDRDVLLVEKDHRIYAIWEWLIEADLVDILSLPTEFSEVESVEELNIPQPAKWFIGYWVNRASAEPCKSPSKWMRSGVAKGSFWSEKVQRRIGKQIHKIDHWKVLHGDYSTAPSIVATWFVDPPYRATGHNYRHGSSNLNYQKLGEWCRDRPGQTIVCEQKGADWMDFDHIADIKTPGNRKKSSEVVWVSGE